MLPSRRAVPRALAAVRGLGALARTRPVLRAYDRPQKEQDLWGAEIDTPYEPEEEIHRVNIKNVYWRQIQRPKSLITGDWSGSASQRKRRERLTKEREDIFSKETLSLLDEVAKGQTPSTKVVRNSSLADDNEENDMYEMIESGSKLTVEAKTKKQYDDYRDDLMNTYDRMWDDFSGGQTTKSATDILKMMQSDKMHLVTQEDVQSVLDTLDNTRTQGRQWVHDFAMTDNMPMGGISYEHTDPEIQPDVVHPWADEQAAIKQDFYHQTVPKLREHAKELMQHAKAYKPPPPENILTFRTRNVVYSGSILETHQFSKRVELFVRLVDLQLGPVISQNIIDILQTRYNGESGIIRLVSRALPTRSLNKYDVETRLAAVINEARKIAEEFPEESMEAARQGMLQAELVEKNGGKEPGPKVADKVVSSGKVMAAYM